MYIFSNRNNIASQMFSCWGGSKGSITIIRETLKRSETTSARIAPYGTSLYFTFDNVQHLIKHWRLFATSSQKGLAAIATSAVQTFPDGLKQYKIQYIKEYSPLVWLHKFHISKNDKYLVNSYNSKSLHSMLGMPTTDLNIILRFFYEHVKKEINIVQKELENKENDFIDDILFDEEKKSNKVCLSGHININPRAQRKYCSIEGCKQILLDQFEESEQVVDYIESSSNTSEYKRLKIDQSESGESVKTL